jgi:hypothetical protein
VVFRYPVVHRWRHEKEGIAITIFKPWLHGVFVPLRISVMTL